MRYDEPRLVWTSLTTKLGISRVSGGRINQLSHEDASSFRSPTCRILWFLKLTMHRTARRRGKRRKRRRRSSSISRRIPSMTRHGKDPGDRRRSVSVFITAGPITKLFAWGGGDIGGHVLRETTSRGLCGRVCPGE